MAEQAYSVRNLLANWLDHMGLMCMFTLITIGVIFAIALFTEGGEWIATHAGFVTIITMIFWGLVTPLIHQYITKHYNTLL